ncbi:MAG: hypothetical protein IPG31_02480 [Nitrosomonas sp.]|nr:hypothetical protein [Nitrosomonas sp.]
MTEKPIASTVMQDLLSSLSGNSGRGYPTIRYCRFRNLDHVLTDKKATSAAPLFDIGWSALLNEATIAEKHPLSSQF